MHQEPSTSDNKNPFAGESFQPEIEKLSIDLGREDFALMLQREDLDMRGQVLCHIGTASARVVGPDELEINISGMGSSSPPGLAVIHMMNKEFDVRRTGESGFCVMAPYNLSYRFNGIAHNGIVHLTTASGRIDLVVK